MNIPLSLYIHIPWCITKCPYCDFNSHAMSAPLPEQDYCAALLDDLQQDLPYIHDRPITSIFFGGGTPSLFSPESIDYLLTQLQQQLNLTKTIEITLEANPNTSEHSQFKAYRQAGINRISIGVQSFQDDKLRTLGRVHDTTQACAAINSAQQAGLASFNIDLMYGLPQQSVADAMADLQQALAFKPKHLSWYQLTLEPNTHFYKKPPTLPDEEHIAQIEQQGYALMQQAKLTRYEVSAFAATQARCQHNLNYWQFGDYIGLGAGAHGKITLPDHTIIRTRKVKHPKLYLDPQKSYLAEQSIIKPQRLAFEFMLNALRLYQDIPLTLFKERTFLALSTISAPLQQAVAKGLITINDQYITITTLGHRFLNDLISLFLGY